MILTQERTKVELTVNIL